MRKYLGLLISLLFVTGIAFAESKYVPLDEVAEKAELMQKLHGPTVEVPMADEGQSRVTGDDCTDPIIVNIPGDLPYQDLGQTNCGRGNTYANTCLGSYDGGEDVVYQFVVTEETTVDIFLDPLGTSWTGILLDDNCPGDDGTCLATNTGSSGIRSLTDQTLAPGTYYFMADTWPTPNCIPAFNLTVDFPAGPLPGDTCADPIPLDLPAVNMPGNGFGYGDDYDSSQLDCTTWYLNGFDIVYSISIPDNGVINGSITTPGYYGYPGLFVLDGCPDTFPTCIAGASGGQTGSFINVPIAAGEYFVVVSNWPSPDLGAYEFSLDFAPAVEGCTDPAALNWDPLANFPCGGDNSCCEYPEEMNCNDGIDDGGDGFIDCADDECADFWMCAPGGECPTALPYPNINDPAVYGTTPGSYTWHWYVVTLDGPYDATFSLCGSLYDTKLEVWGDCGDGTYLGYNDDFCGLDSQISLAGLTAGDYYVKVYGYGSGFGDYVLEITGEPLIEGCTDPIAENFDPEATVPCNGDNSCCEYIYGCTDPIAENFDPLATMDDGSCEYIWGCTNPDAANYCDECTADDGTCYCINPPDATADPFNQAINLNWEQDLGCGEELTIQYSDNSLQNAFYYYAPIEDGFGHGTRFDAPNREDFEVTTIAAKILSEGDPYWPWPNATHGPIRMFVYDDDGGFPGSVIWAGESTVSVDGWAYADPGVAVNGPFYVVLSHWDNWSVAGDAEGFGIDGFVDYPNNMVTLDTGFWYYGDYNFYGGDYMIAANVVYYGGREEVLTYSDQLPTEFAQNSAQNSAVVSDGSPVENNNVVPPSFNQTATRDLISTTVYRNGFYFMEFAAGVNSHTDAPLVNGTEYCYTFIANYEEGTSESSAPVCATPIPGLPAQNLMLEDLGGAFWLTWTPPEELDLPFDSFDVLRDGEVIGNTMDFEFVDDTILAGVDYCYEIVALYPDGPAAASNTVCGFWFLDPPVGLTVEWVPETRAVASLNWLAPGSCAAIVPEYVIDDECYDFVIDYDSFCCEVVWDSFCDAVYYGCTGEEPPLDCVDILAPYFPTDEECIGYVYSIDSFCCDVMWDSICQSEYDYCLYGYYYYESQLSDNEIRDLRRAEMGYEIPADSNFNRDLTGIEVWRNDELVTTLPADALMFEDVGPFDDYSEYCWEVRSVYDEGWSIFSNMACEFLFGPPPAPVTDVTTESTWDDFDGAGIEWSWMHDGGLSCEELNLLEDCVGTCFDESFLVWIGDGFCDDGAYGLDFMCEEWNFDDGDCDGDPQQNNDDKEHFGGQVQTVFNLADGNQQGELNTRDRETTYSLQFIYNGYGYEFLTGDLFIEIVGFLPGEEVCGTIFAIDPYGQYSDPSDEACGIAGNPPQCDYPAPTDLVATPDEVRLGTTLTWNMADYEPPVPNFGDVIEAAYPIEGVPFEDFGTTIGFTNDYDEGGGVFDCPYSGSLSPDVVYEFDAGPGDYHFDICDSDYDTKIYVYDDSMTLLNCADDSCSNPAGNPFRSDLYVSVAARTVLYIVVDGYGSQEGNYHLTADYGSEPLSQDNEQPYKEDNPEDYPVTRDCEVTHFNVYAEWDVVLPVCDLGDFVIDQLPFYAEGTNLGMVNDFDVSGGDGEDVAFELAVYAPIVIDAELCGSDYDTKLEIFSADFDCSVASVAYNDDACGLDSGLYGVALDEGLYYIVVDGYNGATGFYTLNVSQSARAMEQPSISELMELEANKTGVYPDLADMNLPNPDAILYHENTSREFFFIGSTDQLEFYAAGIQDGCFYVTADDMYGGMNESEASNTACSGDPVCPCGLADVNCDTFVNVLDIVQIVGYILNPDDSTFDDCQIFYADYNGDGFVNVLDIVQIVGIILNPPARGADATSANLIQTENGMSIEADGYVGAVQMTLSHGNDFSIDLTNDALVAEYVTNGNQTVLIVVGPVSDLFTAEGAYEIVEVIAANSDSYINVGSTVPGEFSLSNAYPNPFNPTTSLQLNMPADGFASVKVFNLRGQVVATIVEDVMTAGFHQLTWNAGNIPSGMYLIQAEVGSDIAVQKVMLLK